MSVGNGDAKADVENSPPRKPEREATKKIIRVLTVLAYLSSVSTAAIMLSLYYIFLWNPMPPNAAQTMPSVSYPQMPKITPESASASAHAQYLNTFYDVIAMSTTGKPEIKLAGTESKDKMYEPKHKKRLVRVLTVIAYVFSVSLAAITLSLFYIFIYNPDRPAGKMSTRVPHLYNNTSYMLRPDDDRVMNRTWLAPEEPRALPVQIGEPPRINDDMAHLNSDDSSSSWESQETAMRGKRSIRKVLNVLKLVGAS